MPSVSTPVQGEKTKDNKPAASRDAAMGAQEAMPPVTPSGESEQGAMPPDSTQSQAAAGSTQKAKTATELADPKAFFDTVCRCGSEKSFKECSCSTAAFVKLALAQASLEEPQWDLLQEMLDKLQSTAKRRKLSGASSSSAQEAMPPDTGPRKVPMKAPPATKPRPVPAKAAPSSRPPMQEPQASSSASDESERKRRKEEEAERRKREAEENLKKEREAASTIRETIMMADGMYRERRFQTTPDGHPYESIGPRDYDEFKKYLDDYIDYVEDYALPITPDMPDICYMDQEDHTDRDVNGRNQGGLV